MAKDRKCGRCLGFGKLGGSVEVAVDCPDCGGSGETVSPDLGGNPTWLESHSGDEYERTGLKIGRSETKRGFGHIVFKDRYGEVCSLQESSLATEAAIWLGVDDPWPKLFYGRNPPGGWQDMSRDLPEGVESVLCSGRMHLTSEQVRVLLPILTHFVETEYLPSEGEELARPKRRAWALEGLGGLNPRDLSSTAREYLTKLLELNALIADGKKEDPRAVSLRVDVSSLIADMSEEDRTILGRIVSLLYEADEASKEILDEWAEQTGGKLMVFSAPTEEDSEPDDA